MSKNENKKKQIDLIFTLSILLIVVANIVCAIIKDSLPKTILNTSSTMADGYSGVTTTYPANIIIINISVVVILALVLIRRKLIPTIAGIIAIIALVLLPVRTRISSGGIAGETQNITCSVLVCYEN